MSARPAQRRVHVGVGHVELLWHLRKQSVSTDDHRYGNLGRRAGEPRRPVA